jgi:uncharacterized repeat protein (TIGR01451 family)
VAFGVAVAVLAVLAGLEATAHAIVEGQAPTPFQSYRVFGDGKAIGNTLMENPPPNLLVNTELLPESTATLTGIPTDAVPQDVFVWWSASLAPGQGQGAVDNFITLTVADGATTTVAADQCRFMNAQFDGGQNLGMYYCRADVTAFVTAHPGMFAWNGDYTVADVFGDPGRIDQSDPLQCAPGDPLCQAKYAAWSMVFVYDSPSDTLQRDVILYDGFAHMDETNQSLGIITFSIAGFEVGTPPAAELTYFGLEGDQQLGAGPGGHCNNCPDFFRLDGVNLTDGFNPPGNSYNSSDALGLDLDEFNVGATGGGLGILQTGDTSAQIQTGTGDNVVNGMGQTGESVFLGWVFLRLNRPSPNFRGASTVKLVDKSLANPGDTLFYSLNVANQGSLTATNVVLADVLPAGVAYQPGSIRIDGVACSDAADADGCTVSGGNLSIKLGTIPNTGNNDRLVTFRATLTATGVGEQVCNVASVTATEAPTAAELGPACTLVKTATLGQPQKIDADLTGGFTGPDDVIQYTVTIPGDPTGPVGGVSFVDDVPAGLALLAVTGPGGGATDLTTFTGGANGNGRVRFDNITIATGGTATVTMTLQVDSEAEFAADGVPAGAIHGRAVCNQGTISAAFLPASLLTDDPATAAAQDQTCLTLTYAPLLGSSTKTVVDDDGGLLDPGDTLTYTITLANSGNRAGTISLVDDLPPAVESFTLLTPVAGTTFTPPPAGANGTGRLDVSGLLLTAGASVQIRFRVAVKADAADGTVIQNAAALSVAERPEENRTLSSAALTVFARPDLTSFTKAVSDPNGGAVVPGDTLVYTLSLTNTGNRAATATAITDVVDANLSNVLVLSGGGTFAAATRTITWTVGSVAVGATVTVAFSAQVVLPLDNGTTIANQATVDSAEVPPPEPSDDPTTAANNDPTVVTVVSAPDLGGTTKTVTDLNGAPFRPGDVVEYAITVPNSGTANASGVVVTDVVDANLTAIQPLDGGTLTGATISWNLGAVVVGVPTTVRFRATIQAPLLDGTQVANQASVSAAQLPQPIVSDDPTTAAIDDPTIFTVTSQAIFTTSTISLEDLNGGQPQPGDAILYTINVVNTGDSPGTQVVVTLPADVAFATVVPASGGVFNPATRTVTWTLAAAVLPGAPVLLEVTATLADTSAAGTVVCEAATIDSLQSAPFTTPSACFTVVAEPDLSATTKTVVDQNGGQVVPGDVLAWTITVDNAGAAAALATVVSDVVDSNLTAVEAQGGGTFDPMTRTIVWSIPSIPARSSQVVRFTAQVAAPLDDGTVIANQGRVTCAGCVGAVLTDDPATALADDPTIVVVAATAALTVTKTVADDDGGVVDPGDALTYTIRVENSGSACADDVVVTDIVDLNLGVPTPEQGGVFDAANGLIRWSGATTASLVRLCPGAVNAVTLRFHAAVDNPLDSGTVICNQAEVVSEDVPTPVRSDDPTTAAPSDPTCTTVVSGASFAGATKTVVDSNGAPVRPGDLLTYTIRFTNQGNANATEIEVRDPIDPSLTAVMPGEGGQLVGNEIVWSSATTPALALVTPGQTITLSFTAAVRTPLDGGTVISNQATISAQGGVSGTVVTDDPATAAMADPTRVAVVSTVGLRIEKTVVDENGGDVNPSDVLAWTVSLTATGDAAARTVVVSDPVDPNLDVVQVLGGGIFDAGSRVITWNVAEVTPGAPALLGVRTRIQSDTPGDTEVSNQARVVRADDPTPRLSDDPTTTVVDDPTRVIVRAIPQPDVRVRKRVSDENGGVVQVGDRLRYTIEIENVGTAAAAPARVVDALPGSTQYVTATTTLDGTVVPDAAVLSQIMTPPGMFIGALAPGQTRTVGFTVRVAPGTLRGTVISNQAELVITGASVLLSDDPDTAAPGDATQVIVGGGALLTAVTKRFDPVPVGDDGDGMFELGEVVQYRVAIENSGDAPARGVSFSDVIADGGQYVTGTLTRDGQPLSDEPDADAGEVVGRTLTVRAGELSPGVSVVIGFRVRIQPGGAALVNQGRVDSDDTPPELTDADGNDGNGDQPTVVNVGSTASNLIIAKQVADLSGGVVSPGDQLGYTITVTNAGATRVAPFTITDALRSPLDYIAGSTTWPGSGDPFAAGEGLRMPNLGLDPGETLVVTFRVRLAAGAAQDTTLCNQADAIVPTGDAVTSEPACVTVGLTAGTARLGGRVYIDAPPRDRIYQAARDEALAGVQIVLYGDDSPGQDAIAGVTSAADGRYHIDGVPPGEYTLRAFSVGGAQLARQSRIAVVDSELDDHDVWVDPSGRLYDATTGKLVSGEQVFLRYDETDGAEPGALVPPDRLQPGQQGQVTSADGIYRFDVLPGRKYRLEVATAASPWAFPSQILPAQAGLLAEGGPVVPEIRPSLDPKASQRYFLRFDIGGPEDEVTNNHVPVDPLVTQVRLAKRVDRPDAVVGEILTYTVTVQNRSARDLTAAAGQAAFVLDAPARGLTYLPGQAVAQIRRGSDVTRLAAKLGGFQDRSLDGRQVRFGPFDLAAGATLTLVYQVVVGVDTRAGIYENRAVLVDGAGGELSNADQVKLRVKNDPIFDEGLVIGRAFCDSDGDGRVSGGERGVMGARIYVDTGSYAVTDSVGKYHLSALDPGMHLFKLDPDTLPPGSRISDEAASKIVHFTRGFTTRIDFPLHCGELSRVDLTVAEGTIKLSGKTKVVLPPKPVFPKTSTTIAGDLATMALLVDGKVVTVPRAELELVADPALLVPRDSGGLNLVAPGDNGYAAPRPLFRGRLTDATPQRYRLTIRRVQPTGELSPVRTISGEGAPGDIAWDGLGDDGKPAPRDGVYLAQLAISAEGAIEVASPRLAFGIAYGVPVAEERTEILRGTFFTGGAKKPKPSKALTQHIAGLAGRIGPNDTVVIEVHADGTGNRLARIAETQKQADLVRDLLLAATGLPPERIKAGGRGSLDPVADAKTKVGRAANRRLVVRVTPPPPRVAGAPVPPALAASADALIQAESAVVDEAGRFVKNVATPQGGKILVDLQARDGRRLTMSTLVPGRGQAPVPDAARSDSHTISGDLAAGTVLVDGLPLDTSLMMIDVGIEGAAPGSEPDFKILPPRKARKVKRQVIPALPARLERPVRFTLDVPSQAPVGTWSIAVTDDKGASLWRSDGRGLPPPTLDWDGTDTSGALVVKAGARYQYRVEVETFAAYRGTTPQRVFTVGLGKQKGGFNPVTIAGGFGGNNDLSAGLKNQLARFTTTVKKRPVGETYRVEIVVATGAKETETQARLKAAARASKLKTYLGRLKAPVDRIDVVTTVVAPDAPKATRKSRTLITAIPPPVAAPMRAVVDGQTATLSGNQFSITTTTPAGGALVIDVTRPGGQRGRWVLVPDGSAPAPSPLPSGPASQPSRASPGPDDTDLGGPGFIGAPRKDGVSPDDPLAPGAAAAARLDRGPTLTLSLADDEDEFGGAELENALAEPESVTPRPADRDDPLPPGAADGSGRAGAQTRRTAANAKPREIIAAGTTTKVKVPAQVLAADLTVALPPRGLELAAPDLWVSGQTNPRNRLRINGREVVVRADGRFDELVSLPVGESALTVEATDPDDNVALITWPVRVAETQQFLLVLADGSVSTAYQTGDGSGWTADGAEQDGMTDATTVRAGHVLFHGRVALYYKGRIKGNRLFKRIGVTAHVDTARQAGAEEFFQSTLDPKRDYAVYGDSADEVRDANARGKLYVMVEADESRAVIGNVHTDVRSGGELFRYDRTVYGAVVDFKKTFTTAAVGKVEQEAKLFATTGDGRLARDVNVFRATGGSLYYLQHGRVVEGGERVRLVVRERDNGLRLSERPLGRDSDYVIDYAGGRIMFKTPIASTVDGAFLLDNPEGATTPLDGNPVYVEVEYEYQPDEGDGHAAAGAYVRDTLFETISIGAGIVGEGRGDDVLGDYSLAGIDAQYRPKRRTTVRVELARSSATDGQNALSLDGGLTFQGLNGIATTTPDGGRGAHYAWKIDVDTTLGDWAQEEWAERLRVKAYAQVLDRGFFSGGSILEQGRSKVGLWTTYALTAVDTLTVRHDSDWAELPRIGPTPGDVAPGGAPLDTRTSHLTTLAWQRAGKRVGYKAELSHQAVRSASVDTDRIGVGGQVSVKLNKRLTLRAGQELIWSGSDRDPRLNPIDPLNPTRRSSEALAGLTTSVGADWEIAPKVFLGATAALRWNGDTAAQLGLKTPVGDDASMYASERVETFDGRLVNTSIVGAEQRFGARGGGKAYGEYQLESGVAGNRNRAVLGVGHRWSVTRGLSIAGGFEHQQVFGASLPDGTAAGDSTRDVIHLGVEWLRPDKWKASASVEVRYDQGLANGVPSALTDPRPSAPPGTFADHGGTAPGAPLTIPGGERLQIVASTGGSWTWSDDLTFLGRFRLAHTEDLTNRDAMNLPGGVSSTVTQARFLEATAGFAYRPLRFDWLDVLFRYSFLLDQRPLGPEGERAEDQAHVVAVAPVATLPLRLKLSGKLAWKHTRAESELIADQTLAAATDAVLFLVRLGYRFTGKWDLSTEYRALILDMPVGTESRQGVLFEVDYELSRFVRLGLGYNFSHFADDELGDLGRDTHGFFLRVVGRF